MTAPVAWFDSTAPTMENRTKSTRNHGTHARYVLGPDAEGNPGKGCRCEACRVANRLYERERARRIEPAYVGAEPAREHMRMLSEHGIGLRTVARLSGVSNGALSKLMFGSSTRGTPPSKRIRRAALEAILAVTPSQGADGSRLPAGPTLAGVERLVAAGMPKARIAERLGQVGPGLQLGSDFVTRRNARIVAALVDELEAGTLTFVVRSRHGDRIVTAVEERPERALPSGGNELLPLVEALEARVAIRSSWGKDAACRGRPVWMWFPARGDHRTVAAAKKVCGACLVRAECLEANMHERDGIFGGLSGKERRDLRSRAVAS